MRLLRIPGSLAAVAALVLGLLVVTAPARAALPLEDYASYQPQTTCRPKARPGTVELGRWLVRRYGGGFGGISRPCSASTSEHHEGRAFDWMLDAGNRADRQRARRFLTEAFAADAHGNPDARARRMGVMYVIWNDRMYAAWDGFRPQPYKSSSCKRLRTCSPTLRHRDHVHISLTRKAARGETSWYLARR